MARFVDFKKEEEKQVENDEAHFEFFKKKILEQIEKDKSYSGAGSLSFKERDVDSHNIGDTVRTVLSIRTEEEAWQFFRGHVVWLMRTFDKKEKEAEFITRQNIGWCFGESMDQEHVDMWNRITKAFHVGFGNHKPSIEEALAIGREWVRSNAK